MEFNDFLKKYQDLPYLHSKMLLSGEGDPRSLRVQLARWVKAGHLIQLKREVYIFAAHFQRVAPSPYLLAAVLTAPSYVSLEKALEFHGLIPEAVFTVTCITTKRPGSMETPLGMFSYNHVRAGLFWGYGSVEFSSQRGYVAHPEKALLDFVYLRSPELTRDYLDELRLQNLEKVNTGRLMEYGERFGKPGMLVAARTLSGYIEEVRSVEKQL